MLNTKYINTHNKIKKKVINLFMPILLGRKKNRIVNKTFYYDNMYYKLFYLIFNHISLMEVFLKDKKIFYNFSKYFQINLYIYLIKTNLIILNLFFHFFYMLFLTFENFEDIYNNIILLKGYKQCLKRKTFLEAKNGWIKPDYGIEFYFKQRINSISFYVLNFNIYKNFYFSKYNLFLLHTKLIYKLFYYFKILQYKVQSFIVLYKKHYKVEKKTRLLFAKSNCMVYKYLNIRLIKYFSFYKLYLKKQLKNNLSINSTLINKNLNKRLINKPIYNNSMKFSYLKKKNDKNIENLKLFNNISLAKHVFKLIFGGIFIPLYYNLFYNNICKLKWLKEIFLKNKVYYKKIFFDFFMKFFNHYLVSTKLIKRCDLKSRLFTDFFYDMTQIRILSKFIHIFARVIKKFISDFFNLNNLPNKIKTKFINFIMKKMKFDLLLKAISLSEFTKIIDFYHIVVNLFEQFLNKDFNIKNFYFNLLDIQKAKNFHFFARKVPFYDTIATIVHQDPLLRKLQYKKFKDICYKITKEKFKKLTRNKFYKNEFNYDPYIDFDYLNEDGHVNYYDSLNTISMFLKNKKKLKIKKNKILFKLSEFLKKKNDKKKKLYFLNLLSKKLKKKKIINKLKIKMKIRRLILFFFKKRYRKFLLNNNVDSYNHFFFKNLLFVHNVIKDKIIYSKNKIKQKEFKLKKKILNRKLRIKLKQLEIKKKLKKNKIIKVKIKNKIIYNKKLKPLTHQANLQNVFFNLIKKKKVRLNSFFSYYNKNKNDKKKQQRLRYKNKEKKKFQNKKRYYNNNNKFRKNKVIRVKKYKKKILKYLRKYKILYLHDMQKIMSKDIRKKHKLKKFYFYNLKIKNKLFNLKYFKSSVTKKYFIYNLLLKKKFKTRYFRFPKKKKKPIFKNRFFNFYNKIKFKLKKRKEKKQIIKKKKIINKKLKLKKKLNLFKSTYLKFELLYLHSLKSKLKKFKNLKLNKIKFKLKKINRKKKLLKKLKINYLMDLVKINKTLKFKYYKFLLIKSLISKLINKNNSLMDDNNIKKKNLNKIIELKKKLKLFKINKLKIVLKNVNNLIKKYNKINFKELNQNSFINNKKITKLNKKKYRFLINKKFIKKNKFNINSRALKLHNIFLYSKNFKRSIFAKKFKEYLKSPEFKKLINYKKHYTKFLEIKKRKRKKIRFKLNYYLKLKGLNQFIKLNKIQEKVRKVSNLQKKLEKNKKLGKIKKFKKTKKSKKIKKLMLIDLKIIKILKQNNIINLNIKKSKLYSNDNIINLINFKNKNKTKLERLYLIKVNIKKKLIIKKKKITIFKKLLKKTHLLNFKKLIKIKILNAKKLIQKSRVKLIKIKKINKKKLINYEKIKLKKLKIKLKKLKIKLKKLKIKNLRLQLLYLKKLKLIKLKKKKKEKEKEKEKNKNKIKKKKKKFEIELGDHELKDKVVKKLQKRYDAIKKASHLEDLQQMERIKFLKKKEEDEVYHMELDENATEFNYGTPLKELKKRHMRRVQGFYRRQYKRLQDDNKKLPLIPRTKRQIFFLVKALKYKKKFKKKLFFFNKYMFFFKILLRTRLNLFKKKSSFRFFFLNKLKNLIKNILFKQKTSYYDLKSSSSSIGINLHDEYKMWSLHYIQLKKIPFKLIRLYSKFYFNKLLYNLKFKSKFYDFYYKYLVARQKVNISKTKPFKRKRVKKLFQILFYKLSKSYVKYFFASRKVIFSLMRNSSFYIRDKSYGKASNTKIYKNSKIKLFLNELKMRRSYYVSKYTRYSNFFFIYWAKKYYGYDVYENYRKNFDTSARLQYYFKFFKSKTFFFNYLINFTFSYIQKLNINIFNYVFILNQYKTKLVIDVNQFYKYLILFFFKKNQYLNFYNLKNKFNFIMPKYFSFFSIYFKQLSIELSNWYSIININLNRCQSTILFNLCFISHNTSAVYLHYKYKYLYYYRVYNFYIFYIFYYLYNHLFKVYKKLKLKGFKLSYDLIKNNEYNRYYLGLRTRMLILTIRNKYKHGFTVEKIFRNIQFFLRESMKKKELAGYYISIRGRYKRSRRSNKLIIKKGVYSFNKIDLKIDSSYGTLNTKYGIAGIKVIFAFK